MRAFATSLLAFEAVAVFPYDPSRVSTFIHITLSLISSVTFTYVVHVISKSRFDATFRTISATLAALSVVIFLVFIMLSKSSFTMLLEAGWWLALQV